MKSVNAEQQLFYIPIFAVLLSAMPLSTCCYSDDNEKDRIVSTAIDFNSGEWSEIKFAKITTDFGFDSFPRNTRVSLSENTRVGMFGYTFKTRIASEKKVRFIELPGPSGNDFLMFLLIIPGYFLVMGVIFGPTMIVGEILKFDDADFLPKSAVIVFAISYLFCIVYFPLKYLPGSKLATSTFFQDSDDYTQEITYDGETLLIGNSQDIHHQNISLSWANKSNIKKANFIIPANSYMKFKVPVCILNIQFLLKEGGNSESVHLSIKKTDVGFYLYDHFSSNKFRIESRKYK